MSVISDAVFVVNRFYQGFRKSRKIMQNSLAASPAAGSGMHEGRWAAREGRTKAAVLDPYCYQQRRQ